MTLLPNEKFQFNCSTFHSPVAECSVELSRSYPYEVNSLATPSLFDPHRSGTPSLNVRFERPSLSPDTIASPTARGTFSWSQSPSLRSSIEHSRVSVSLFRCSSDSIGTFWRRSLTAHKLYHVRLCSWHTIRRTVRPVCGKRNILHDVYRKEGKNIIETA